MGCYDTVFCDKIMKKEKVMLNENVEKAFNLQLKAELYSEYLYLSMEAYFKNINLNGFANWMSIQVQEERAHAMGMFDYITRRGGRVVLDCIEKPQTDWKSVLDVFQTGLNHERLVTSKINELFSVAQENNDRASMIFLNWYISEQVEEEESFLNILNQLEMIKDSPSALYNLDKELAKRQFTVPIIK